MLEKNECDPSYAQMSDKDDNDVEIFYHQAVCKQYEIAILMEI